MAGTVRTARLACRSLAAHGNLTGIPPGVKRPGKRMAAKMRTDLTAM
jgi:hypothetical protein